MRFGPAAEDHDRGPVERRDLVFVLVGAVVVRRARRELGRAGVDGLVGDVDARGAARREHVVLGRRPRGTRAARRRSPSRLTRRQSRRPRSSMPRAVEPRRASRMSSSIWSRNHGSIPVASCSRSTARPRRSAASSRNSRSGVGVADQAHELVVAVRVVLALARVAVEAGAARSRASAAPSGATRGTCARSPSPRRPTASSCRAPATRPGSFSNAQRGTLVTT